MSTTDQADQVDQVSTGATAASSGRADTGGRLPGLGRLTLVRAAVELRQFWRERDAVIFVFAYPIVMLAIFASVFGSEDQGTEVAQIGFAQYFLPGMVATGIMLTSFQSLAVSIAVERDDGTLRRLRATPLPVTAYVGGKVALTLATSVVQTALLLAVAALAFDVPLPTDAGRWTTFAWVFALGAAAGTVCGVGFSSLPRSGRSASAVVTPVVLVLQFISGVFFAFFALPGWMQTLASVFPLKWIAQGMRSVFLPEEMAALETSGSWQHPATAAVLVAWLIVGLVVGVRTFRWRRRDDG
ncbi:ABC transporter permease [Isoptericola sp. NPDC056578]|uniref:ABC transporter permease n=1 Tax=unclassified Isoptericola TaxID=2623355 RepID=UPI00367AB63F